MDQAFCLCQSAMYSLETEKFQDFSETLAVHIVEFVSLNLKHLTK